MKYLLFTFFSLYLFVGCSDKTAHEKKHTTKETATIETYYTCSMHPSVREKKPGKCPICGMNLTKVNIALEHDDHQKEKQGTETYYCKDNPDFTSPKPGTCPLDGSKLVKKSQTLGAVGRVKLRNLQVSHFKANMFSVTSMKMQKNIRLLGTLLKSEQRESNIPARIKGRVEKVFVESTGAFIKKGDPVLKLYSPQLLTGAEEFLIAKKNYFSNKKNKDFKELYEQSIERMKLWGVQESQLDSWAKSGKIPREIIIYSPVTGIVEKKNAVKGKYFKEGESFFNLVDLSLLWVEMDVYEHESALVKIDQSVDFEFSAYPGEKWTGEIDFINPVLNPKTHTLKVRTTLENTDGKLKPGMLAEASLTVKLEGTPLVVPRTAVIDTGKRKIVWLEKAESTYEAQMVRTGFESEGFVEIKEGLNENDKVVIDGNFLLDAQAQLTGAYEDTSKVNAHQH